MKLHEQRDDLEKRLNNVREGILLLEEHLLSSKFNGPDPFDKYINRDDILHYFAQVIKPEL